MAKTYSTYEAKARLSELLNRVRKGEVVTITHRGEPLAEVRAIDRPKQSLSSRLDQLQRHGILTSTEQKSTFKPLAKKPGALRRFLKSRE